MRYASAMSGPDASSLDSAFARWRASHAGYAPLYSESLMKEALEHLAPALRPGAVVLDAGCGEGHITWALATRGARAIGIDHVRAPQWTVSEGSECGFTQASVERLPLRDAVIDALFCFSVLQYVDRGMALDEFSRVLKPGARFAIVDNLDRHPVAALHRVMRHAPWRYPSWREIQNADPRFAERRSRPAGLLAPLLFSWPGCDQWRADVPRRAWPRRAIEIIERCDRFGFALPAARDCAWMALTLGRR